MLFLQFRVNTNRYILATGDIIEIVPYANLRPIPKAPDYIAGLLNYGGVSVPVMDISFMMSGKPCEIRLSSRIVLANYTQGDQSVCMGLLIEHLTETVRYDEDDFTDSGVALEESPYLGKVVIDDNQIVQLVNLSDIIPEAAHDILFHTAHAA